MKITGSTPRAFEFACHSAACAPPPAGTGGSSKTGSRSLTSLQRSVLDRIAKTGMGGARQSEVTRLLKDGLVERISGKGHGMGNTPMWRITEAGKDVARRGSAVKTALDRALAATRAPLPKYAYLTPTVKRRVVGETETMWHLESAGQPLPVRKNGAKVEF